MQQRKKAGAQTQYDTCVHLQQYTGEWLYANGSDTIRIYLRKHRTINTVTQTIMDDLYGWHEYKIGNNIVESNYQYRFMPLPYNMDTTWDWQNYSVSLFIPQGCDNNFFQLRGFITDYTHQMRLDDVRINISADRRTLFWHQNERGATFITDPRGMTLPSTFTLIKQ